MNEPTILDLFAGIGGFSLGFERAGFKTIGFSEIDPYACAVLRKHWPGVPNYGDIKSLIKLITGMPSDQYIEKHGILKRSKIQRSPYSIPETEVYSESGESLPDNPPSNVEDSETQGNNFAAELALWPGQPFPPRYKSGGSVTKHFGRSNRKMKGEEENTLRAMRSIGENEERSNHSSGSSSRLQQAFGSDVALPEMPPPMAQREQSERSIICDVITAGTPCQPASLAGKRRGKNDDRWLWPETFAIIYAIHPTWCLLENVPGFLSLESGVEFECVCAELESYGYSVQAFVIPACAVDAPHRRDRVWIMAYSECKQLRAERLGCTIRTPGEVQTETQKREWIRDDARQCSETLADTASQRINRECENSTSKTGTRDKSQQKPDRRSEDVLNSDHEGCRHISPLHAGQRQQSQGQRNHSTFTSPSRWLPEPAVGRVANGISARVDRLKCLGNAIVPQIAQIFAQALRQFYP